MCLQIQAPTDLATFDPEARLLQGVSWHAVPSFTRSGALQRARLSAHYDGEKESARVFIWIGDIAGHSSPIPSEVIAEALARLAHGITLFRNAFPDNPPVRLTVGKRRTKKSGR